MTDPIEIKPGMTFGLWTVVARGPNSHHGGAQWLVRCKCGAEGARTASNLRTGKTKSCGCMGKATDRPRTDMEKRRMAQTYASQYRKVSVTLPSLKCLQEDPE